MLQFNGHGELVAEILRLKQERNAVILAHNYQVPEVQDIADFVGDSLGLSQAADRTPADVIVFCGVHFMAETASIISPKKTVLLPDLGAGCSLAATIDGEKLRAWKNEHPNSAVVSYINTTAEVKAESDYFCTSGNAVKVVDSIPSDREVLGCNGDGDSSQDAKGEPGQDVSSGKGGCCLPVHENHNPGESC